MADVFAEGVSKWQDKLGLARDAVRQELVTRQLLEYLPTPDTDVRVIDIGSGQGTQANRLADLGYNVIGVDPSEKLLEGAIQTAREHTNGARFAVGTLEEMSKWVGTEFDLVCCHGVLMYMPELVPAIRGLVSLARQGGLISVLTRNPASIAMRAGLRGDWQGAIDGFDARSYTNQLVGSTLRADSPDDIAEAFRESGAEPVSWYGVRTFIDHWDDVPVPDNFETLAKAEYQAGKRDPYRQLAALVHVIAERS